MWFNRRYLATVCWWYLGTSEFTFAELWEDVAIHGQNNTLQPRSARQYNPSAVLYTSSSGSNVDVFSTDTLKEEKVEALGAPTLFGTSKTRWWWYSHMQSISALTQLYELISISEYNWLYSTSSMSLSNHLHTCIHTYMYYILKYIHTCIYMVYQMCNQQSYVAKSHVRTYCRVLTSMYVCAVGQM